MIGAFSSLLVKFKDKNLHIVLGLAFLLFLCLVTYGSIVTHELMTDDYYFINPQGLVHSDYHTFTDYFTHCSFNHYIPLNLFLNTWLFQTFPHPFQLYLFNILFFYIDCALLFFLIYCISDNFLTALLTSTIFCIHPMSAEMIQHIAFNNVFFLLTGLMELSLILLLLYSKHKKPIICYILSVSLMAMGLFCHETILLFPTYAASLLFFLTDLSLKKIVKLVIPYILLSLLLAALWIVLSNPNINLEQINSLSPNNLWISTANFSHVFFWYVGNLILPRNIIFMANMPILASHILYWNALFFGFLSLCGLLMVFYFKKSIESFAIALFLFGIPFAFIGSQSRSAMGVVFEPNWVYFNSIGFYVLITLIILRLRKSVYPLVMACLLSAMGLCLFICTQKINSIAKTQASYCLNWVKQFPGNDVALKTLINLEGIYLIPPELIPDLIDLVGTYIKNDEPEGKALIREISAENLSLGLRKKLSDRLNGKIAPCAIDIKNGPRSFILLSYKLYDFYAFGTASALLTQCIKNYPKYKESYWLLGHIFADEYQTQEAIKLWKQALALDPKDIRFIKIIEEYKQKGFIK